MKILFCASEANPYAGSGGLGDVMGALPKAITDLGKGKVQCECILPLYRSVKEEYRRQMTKVIDLEFSLSWRKTGATVYRLENSGVTYYFVENGYYFDRPAFYGEYDDAERFAFFGAAIIAFMRQTGNIPDILHANDWQAAPAVIYLKTEFAHLTELASIRTVYTIHNIEYQGKFDPYILGDVFGIDQKYYHILEYDGCINLMKGAIAVSDYVSTVSPNYGKELRHDFFAFGLADLIRGAKGKMRGIINGIDYGYFSPEHGSDIYESYGIENVKSGKIANKTALQKELGLPVNENVPLAVMITRLSSGKGIDLVLRILDELLTENMQFVVLGTGEKEYEVAFADAESRHPNMRALIKFDRALSKKMYAAADLFVMPSKSEPCGLAQMIACSYGTIPVVRAVGGLYDSIKPYGSVGANGFTFENYNAHELLFKLKEALALYRNEEEWDMLVNSAKKSDFSWNKSAIEYMNMYTELLAW